MFAIHLMSSICSLLLLTSTVWAAAEISPVHFDTVELPTLQHAKRVGSVNPHQVITFTVWLKLRNKEHLNSFINELYEPHSTRHQKIFNKRRICRKLRPKCACSTRSRELFYSTRNENRKGIHYTAVSGTSLFVCLTT